MKEPPNTCPIINNLLQTIKQINDIEDFESSKREIIDLIEEIRSANSNIRDWGHQQSGKDEIEDLKDEIKSLEQSNSELEDSVKDLEDTIEDLNSEIKFLGKEVSSLELQLSQLENQLSA